ncbi:unnamed protein product [Vitrella brassicaformis CCMP3155]|uniref:ACB domain-containing protein n=1 Tax=Vitrella brassicaformis (strain CCMP3155) TaxID=1169540 RepID=A0A0G4G727_VITBC|nr:unnamed protein product [Vitrella brassicaformis CCMP3155]|mmetsp:Transcript_16891/g.48148  ORF Transcript_16891/g.48148 Transcript_16891/m.48148 type:complete len:102 (-) Transcript_16891:476-781(-)|eukprot:CEM24024.1 unnamed protein product [Vitrella brassicaformis CCMP3155]
MASASDFALAAKFVQSMPKDGPVKPTQDDRLNFYKYYKQATEGDCKGDAPWAIQFEANAKHEAWSSVKGLSADEAKVKYVEALNKMYPSWKEEANKLGLTA